MRVLALIAALLAAGCFQPTETDGAVMCGADDACPPGFQCHATDRRCYREPPTSVVDGAPLEPDGSVVADGGAPDGGAQDGGALDGGGDVATDFCETYETRCGFSGSGNRYDDLGDCLTAFESYDEERQQCVLSELAMAEGAVGGTLNAHCSAAAGNPPCD
jgi:hypothetical protein